MTDKKDDEELTVEFSDQVLEKMAEDPELVKALREFSANMRQAHAAVKAGQYASMEDAVEAITGSRPERLTKEEAERLEREHGDGGITFTKRS